MRFKTHKKIQKIQKRRTKKRHRRRNGLSRRQRPLHTKHIKNTKNTTKRKRRTRIKGGGGELPDCLGINSNDLTECDTDLLKKYDPLTIDKLLEDNNRLLDIYRKIFLTFSNSEDYRKKMPKKVREYIDGINKKKLLECKNTYSRLKNDPTNVDPSIKGDLSKLNPEYVAELVGLTQANPTTKDIIEYFTGITLPKTKTKTKTSRTPPDMSQFYTTRAAIEVAREKKQKKAPLNPKDDAEGKSKNQINTRTTDESLMDQTRNNSASSNPTKTSEKTPAVSVYKNCKTNLKPSTSQKELVGYKYKPTTNDIIETGGGGNCLFYALLWGLCKIGSSKINDDTTYSDIRKMIVGYARSVINTGNNDPGLFEYIIQEEVNRMSGNPTRHLEKMARDGSWGTEDEIMVAAHYFNVDIYVYRPPASVDTLRNNYQTIVNELIKNKNTSEREKQTLKLDLSRSKQIPNNTPLTKYEEKVLSDKGVALNENDLQLVNKYKALSDSNQPKNTNAPIIRIYNNGTSPDNMGTHYQALPASLA